MTRLISVCTSATDAANSAVAAPTTVTTVCAVGLASNIGDSRHTMNTPAVTMVAAWISAETGVGPSIASGSQVCSPNCADLPIAPTNNSKQIVVITSTRAPRNEKVAPAWPGTAARIASSETVPNTMNVAKIPSEKPKSPTRLTTNALIAAALALGLWYQNPINR